MMHTWVSIVGGPLDGQLYALEPGQTEIRYVTLDKLDGRVLFGDDLPPPDTPLCANEHRYLLIRRPSGSMFAVEESVAREFDALQRAHDNRLADIRQKLLNAVGL